MARLCSCSAKFSLPGKRNIICTGEDHRANQYHSKEYCVEVWHGQQKKDENSYRLLPDPVNFHLLGKATT